MVRAAQAVQVAKVLGVLEVLEVLEAAEVPEAGQLVLEPQWVQAPTEGLQAQLKR
jgi:hypothetical protein